MELFFILFYLLALKSSACNKLLLRFLTIVHLKLSMLFLEQEDSNINI